MNPRMPPSPGHGDWLDLVAAADVPPGQARTVVLADHAYAVCNDAGRFAVVDNACPHAGGNLGGAAVRAGRIVCPWHGYQWDLVTGRSPDFPRTLRVHRSRVRDGRVQVRVEL